MKLTYDKVFDRYTKTITDKFAEYVYVVYIKFRLFLIKVFPISEKEKFRLGIQNKEFEESSYMPMGYDYVKHKEEKGVLKLDYIDFYDYLPKEELSTFIKELKRCVSRNAYHPFSTWRTRQDIDRIGNYGRYTDGRAFANIISLKFTKNKFLRNNCTSMSISLCNLSTTFLVVKYRVHVGENFNILLDEICNTKYNGYTSVYRRFDTAWFDVKKFGSAIYTGNDVRKEKIYNLISEIKWKILVELRKNFSFRFWRDNIFPPTFETYLTNIRPSEKTSHLSFWDSVLLDSACDYAPIYNACISWDYKHSKHEAPRIAMYCGGDYAKNCYKPGIAQHTLPDNYATYLTAITLGMIAERDIELCNKKISKVIRKKKTAPVLSARVAVERKIYYSYRFVSEFSGKTIDTEFVNDIGNVCYKNGSISSRRLEGISKRVTETKNQIDNILKLLDDAAEYRSSESNIKLQWIMMLITILSLILAILTL